MHSQRCSITWNPFGCTIHSSAACLPVSLPRLVVVVSGKFIDFYFRLVAFFILFTITPPNGGCASSRRGSQSVNNLLISTKFNLWQNQHGFQSHPPAHTYNLDLDQLSIVWSWVSSRQLCCSGHNFLFSTSTQIVIKFPAAAQKRVH